MEAETHIKDAARQNIFASLIIGLIAAGLGSMVTFMVSRNITNPISKVVEVARLVSRGDLSHRLHSKSQDEVGELAQAIDESVQQSSCLSWFQLRASENAEKILTSIAVEEKESYSAPAARPAPPAFDSDGWGSGGSAAGSLGVGPGRAQRGVVLNSIFTAQPESGSAWAHSVRPVLKPSAMA